MSEERKMTLARNLRRLVPRPWSRFAQRNGLNPKNLYSYLRETNPKAPPGPVLAVIARALNVSMDELLDAAPEGGPAAAPPASGIPILGRAAAGRLAPETPDGAPIGAAAQIRRIEIGGLRVTIIVEPR